MTILVTGGAGFIGSQLCAELIKRQHKVICVDNLITGNERNISNLLSNPLFTFIKRDITYQKLYSEIGKLRNSEIDKINQIYHLASPASPVQYQKYPLETLLVNSTGTLNLLRLTQQTGAKFLYASTSEVYGDPKEHPQKESYWGNVNSFGSRSCYDEAKRYGEAIVYTFIHTYGVNARIARIFNTYGPNMEKNDGRVISNFVSQAVSGKDITIYGKGKQTRSFCYVSDMVDGLIALMESDNTKGEIVNLGNPDERSIQEIAELIKIKTSSNSNIVFKELPKDDPERRKPDITKAKALLNWEPKVGFEEGLNKTIEYFIKLT
jgi:dTDP-glucose 4,6-dehydratase/UDP-glucuronate decarboxylase